MPKILLYRKGIGGHWMHFILWNKIVWLLWLNLLPMKKSKFSKFYNTICTQTTLVPLKEENQKSTSTITRCKVVSPEMRYSCLQCIFMNKYRKKDTWYTSQHKMLYSFLKLFSYGNSWKSRALFLDPIIII